MTKRSNPSFLTFSAREARDHALILAVVLWIVAAVLLLFGTSHRDPFDQLKWNDFVHFYTLGHIAQTGQAGALYDASLQYAEQVRLVPESAPDRYLPAYPPQIALVFVPLSHLPYLLAGFVWAAITIGLYALSIAWSYRRADRPGVSRGLAVAAAAGFPPLWSLVLNGQSTIVVVVGFTLATWALTQERRVLAGAALGLLFMKPQFGLLLAAIVLICREWSLLVGLLLSGLAQAGLVVSWLGARGLTGYAGIFMALPSMRGALEPEGQEMHSLATVTGLLPEPYAMILWALLSLGVVWVTRMVWLSSMPTSLRMAGMVLGSVLVNPHVNSYDLVVVAVPLLVVSAYVASGDVAMSTARSRWYQAVYLLFLLLLLPTARFVGLQFSVFVLCWMLWELAKWARQHGGEPDAFASA